MIDYAEVSRQHIQAANTLASRFDDGSENAGTLALVEAQLSTTYAILALVDATEAQA